MKRTTEVRCPDCRSTHVRRIGGAEVFDAPHTGATPSMEVGLLYAGSCEACSPTPEPATLFLVGTGMASAGAAAWRRRRAATAA